MAWRETDRAKAVVIRRKYRCTDCSYEFMWVHGDENEEHPSCPACAVATDLVPPNIAIRSNKSRAIDYAQQVAEEDWGVTNMSDNQRAGDTISTGDSSMPKEQREALVKDLVQAGMTEQAAVAVAPSQEQAVSSFWNGMMPATGISGPGLDAARQVAAPVSQQQAREGTDAVGMLEAGRKTGNMNIKLDVVARANMDDAA